jgi:hypothetical protein
MQPYGSDRIRVAEDGRVILVSRRPKGWEPRIAKTLTTSEHPGTAVLFGEEYYEVVEASAQEAGGVRYVLTKWKDEHAIRVSDRYDEESENARIAKHDAAVSREKKRVGATLIGILIGHLPAMVQERMASELGLLPVRLTLLSLLLPFAIILTIVWRVVSTVMAQDQPSLVLVIFAAILFAESIIRFFVAMTQARPLGSIAGFLVYLLAYGLGPKREMVSPFAVPKGYATTIATSPEEDRAIADEILLKEPLLTLLSKSEQYLLAARYGYDYRRQSWKTAVHLLVIAFIGIGSSVATLRHTPRLSAAVSLVVAILLGIEQFVRLKSLRNGPAPSVLGVIARPFARRLLKAAAKGPEEEV